MPANSLPLAGSTAPFRGEFRISLKPDGTVVVPDLAEPLIPMLRAVGADESLWRKEPCVVAHPVLAATRACSTGFTKDHLESLTDTELWELHRQLQDGHSAPRTGGASLLDLKIILARRLLAPCLLCERRCGVNRLAGETGFCGLGEGLQVAAHAMLYNEGPLVGAPTFAVFLRGCSLRCSFCYRPDELRAKGREETTPDALAEILDQAALHGAESWHFLGGNPDESLPGILLALALTRQSCPLVWNSALMLTPPALELLKGVVDIWLPDFKFGTDDCARRIAGIDGYIATIERNLALLADQPNVVVRHMTNAGHDLCCTRPITMFIGENYRNFRIHVFPKQDRVTPLMHR